MCSFSFSLLTVATCLEFTANAVVRTLDESDELSFFRIRSKKHEIMIAPDKEYLLVVIQDPNQ